VEKNLKELELPTFQVPDDDDEKLKAVLNCCIRKIANNTSKGITSDTTENKGKEEVGLYLQAERSASGEIFLGLIVMTLFLVVNEGERFEALDGLPFVVVLLVR
jgi:hypothetical protein